MFDFPSTVMAGFESSGLAGVPEAGGAESAEAEEDAELPLLKRGGSSSPEPPPDFDELAGGALEEGVADVELPAAGAEPDLAGVVFAALVSCVRRGGPLSSAVIPTGALSAFIEGLGSSDPVGCHAPVAIQGASLFRALLCRALFTVNNPNELPVCSASYTVPGSKDIGTGSALYALASQNFPLIKIAIGTSDIFFPSLLICNTAMARGPASFFLGAFLSPTGICGRSSCAAANGMTKRKTSAIAQQATVARCKLFNDAGCRSERGAPGLAVFARPGNPNCVHARFISSGEIPMQVNDKAPDFTLQDENGKQVSLKDFRGKIVVLYFYPKANTPG